MKIAIDTNIFIYAARFRIDILSQLSGNEIFTTESVINELEKISAGKSRDAKAAALALAILKKWIKEQKIKILPSKTGSADDDLLRLGKLGYVILTQDKELLERLKSAKCGIAFIRQRKYFVFEGRA